VKIKFVAGFGPIVRDLEASGRFYREVLGLPLPEGQYMSTDKLEGVKHFGLWRIEDAAQSCFGTDQWPADLPIPSGGMEFDVETEEAVAEAALELQAQGVRILVGPRKEPWGQTVLRFLSPEGLLLGITYTPWMH